MAEKDIDAVKEHDDDANNFSFDFCGWMSDMIEPRHAKRTHDIEKDDEMVNFLSVRTRELGGRQFHSVSESVKSSEGEEEKGRPMSMQDKFSMGILLLLYTLQASIMSFYFCFVFFTTVCVTVT